MIETLTESITPITEDKTIIGGNFSRWYGGFQSYMIATESNNPIYVQSSHSSRYGEDQIPNLNVLPRMIWIDWMKSLSSFKYAVHMMPTIAAGTFSLNCAYFGIPCIGNVDVDTQRICFPELSFRPENVNDARLAFKKLNEDENFYTKCKEYSNIKYKENFSIYNFIKKLSNILV
jgi:hypothetical protein